jgi:hypothetical protein
VIPILMQIRVASDVILPRKACISSLPLRVNTKTIKTPVPETDTGRLVENTKGRERTLSKELGKLAP